jgi:hypothetical protein
MSIKYCEHDNCEELSRDEKKFLKYFYRLDEFNQGHIQGYMRGLTAEKTPALILYNTLSDELKDLVKFKMIELFDRTHELSTCIANEPIILNTYRS